MTFGILEVNLLLLRTDGRPHGRRRIWELMFSVKTVANGNSLSLNVPK